MPSTCNFLYDRPNSVYFSGDILNGKIILTTDNEKVVRGIYITIKGTAKVKWTESRSRYNSRTKRTQHYTVVYQGETQYINSRVLVEGAMDYPPGVHEYTFSTPLPPQIPSSISGEHGRISYEVELRLDRPLRFDNVYTSFFTVIRPLDLNMDPMFQQPVLRKEEKYFGCCCCESGPLKSELRTEFSGYAPGQIINFTLFIDNEANKDIDSSVVEFCQNMAFKSNSPEVKVKNRERVIGQIRVGGAMRLTKKLHTGSITVPPLPPSTMNPCDIIAVTYYLKAEIETGCCSANEDVRANITIGTVPLYASATNPNSVITVQPTAPSIDTPGCDDGDKPPHYNSVVPPSFEEATEMDKPFVDQDEEDHRIAEPYVPKYPVYHNFATPSAPTGEHTPLIQQSWQSPQLVPGGARPVVEQPSSSQNNSLPYPTEPVPGMPVVGESGPPPPEKSAGPNLGWRT